MDADLNSEKSPASAENGGQSEVSESSLAKPLASEVAAPAAAGAAASEEGSSAALVRDEGEAKAVTAERVEPPTGAEKRAPAGGNSSRGTASSDAAADTPLGRALAALSRRDYATAKRLFEEIGHKDAASAIENALAALDRKDYATAHGLFEALAPLEPAPSAGNPIAADSPDKARYRPATPRLEIVPSADAANRPSAPPPKKAKARGSGRWLLRSGFVFLAIFIASAMYIAPENWTFAAVKTQAIAGLASAVDLVKPPLEAITGQSEREADRAEMHALSAALTQVTIRLDQMEHDYGARLDKLDERIDPNSSSRFADIAERVDELEKKATASATPAPELADLAARLDKLERNVSVAASHASELAAIASRLDRLEKRAAVPAVTSDTPLPPVAPRQSTHAATAEASGSNEIARLENPGPLLRDYSVEDVQGGVAVVDGRYGPQEVAPGDVIPGAGRVLRIERRGGNWFVVTSRGVIASSPAGR